MVCKAHLNTKEEEMPTYAYPGDLIPEVEGLNYRERCVLSPIKLMTQITRKSTLLNGRIGHYEVSGAVGLKHNYEFAEMAYGAHPLLARYKLQPLMYSLVNYHIKENAKHIGIRRRNEWPNNYLLPEDTVHPQASEPEFEDLYIGQDSSGMNVRMSHPSLLAFAFPLLVSRVQGSLLNGYTQ
ncbi:hypothetical protein EDC96DRAFT_556060 [Choanephora cucurbitarum]|nr:hypothetical protein EDC96DRAFT_556060 [Choanephora cucurbitarum]